MPQITMHGGHILEYDEIDEQFVCSHIWHAKKSDNTHYAVTNIKLGKNKWTTVRFHRVALGVTDRWVLVDHKDGNGLNNRRNNLRLADSSTNVAHTVHRKSRKHRGITVLPSGKFRAKIRHMYRYIHIGCYATEGEAAAAYDRKALELFGEFAYQNKERAG